MPSTERWWKRWWFLTIAIAVLSIVGWLLGISIMGHSLAGITLRAAGSQAIPPTCVVDSISAVEKLTNIKHTDKEFSQESADGHTQYSDYSWSWREDGIRRPVRCDFRVTDVANGKTDIEMFCGRYVATGPMFLPKKPVFTREEADIIRDTMHQVVLDLSEQCEGMPPPSSYEETCQLAVCE